LTSFPHFIENKPDNKTLIKVERNYNKDVSSDYQIKSASEFLEEGYLEKIISTKKVEHKELT